MDDFIDALESLKKEVIKGVKKQSNQSIFLEKIYDLEESYKELKEKFDRLDATDEKKDLFLQNISHELRTPLTSIIGYMDVILGYRDLPSTISVFLKIVFENSLYLKNILDKLLDLTEIESGNYKLNISKVDIEELLKDRSDCFKKQADKKKINLELVVNKSISDNANYKYIYLDESKIKKVINNLISNAINFTMEGEVKVILDADDDQVVISFKDTGKGIAKEHLGSLFDKYKLIESKITTSSDGAGLGLPVSKRLVDLHKGSIEVESEYRQGSTFIVKLPRIFG